MYAWLIGCSTHGISSELLSKTKDSLALMNDLTSDGQVDGDNYQAPDFAAAFKRNLRELMSSKSTQNIWLVTTGYKLRQAHDNACNDLRACNLQVPREIDYIKAKKATKDVIYSCNRIKTKTTGWGRHTQERVDEAWDALGLDTADVGLAQHGTMTGCGCRQVTAELFWMARGDEINASMVRRSGGNATL